MTVLLLIIASISFWGCERNQRSQEQQSELHAETIQISDSIKKEKSQQPISELPRGLDTTIDESSRFIAGLPLASNRLRGMSQNLFYQSHSKRLSLIL